MNGHRSRVASPLPLSRLRLAVHRANLATARATPGEQPYVVGWNLERTPQGLVVVLDVDDDADHRRAWMAHLDGQLTDVVGTPLPEECTTRVVHLPLDAASQRAQLERDGLLDRFHATREATRAFADEARAFLADGVLYCLDTAGVRTWWPTSPLEPPLEQTLADVEQGYGGPVGYAVTAVDDAGWRRVRVEAMGTVTYETFSRLDP